MPNPTLDSIFGPNWKQAVETNGTGRIENGGWILVANPSVYGDREGGGITYGPTQTYSLERAGDDNTMTYTFDPSGNFQRADKEAPNTWSAGIRDTILEGGPQVAAFALGANYLFPAGGFGSAGGALGAESLSGMDLAADTPGWFGGGSAGASGAGLSGMDLAADTPGFGGAWTPGAGGSVLSPSTPLQSVGGVGSNAVTPVTAAAAGGGSPGLFGLSPSTLGAGASLLGGLAGSQGVQKSETTSNTLNPQLQGAMFGDLLPKTQGLLGEQMPAVSAAGQQMASVGSGLLATQAPTYGSNPYLSAVSDDITRRVNDATGQQLLGIQGNSVASGGLGGARQGVAQGIALKGAADSLAGQLAGMNAQQYNFDQSNYLNRLNLGANLTNTGYGMAWQPLKSAAGIYGSLADATKTTTSTSSQGGGAQGFAGGVLGGAQFAKNAGWWS